MTILYDKKLFYLFYLFYKLFIKLKFKKGN